MTKLRAKNQICIGARTDFVGAGKELLSRRDAGDASPSSGMNTLATNAELAARHTRQDEFMMTYSGQESAEPLVGGCRRAGYSDGFS